MNKKEQISIYKIYFPEPNKCYIGQTSDPSGRMHAHLRGRDGMISAVHKALQKYDEWDISVLCICGSRDEANAAEVDEISAHNSIAPDGYNLRVGGGGGSWCEESKDKMRGDNNPAKRPEVRAKISKASKVRANSSESIAKFRKLMLGNKNCVGLVRGPHTGEWLAEMSKLMTGDKNPINRPEVRAKHKAAVSSPETRAKMSAAKLGHDVSDQTKLKISVKKRRRDVKRIESKLRAELGDKFDFLMDQANEELKFDDEGNRVN